MPHPLGINKELYIYMHYMARIYVASPIISPCLWVGWVDGITQGLLKSSDLHDYSLISLLIGWVGTFV
uniref:Uncharacterized protein n=1 Tax=Picea glauca TaxID=3330 RepID=A0A101M2U7_PICGL|nr:hypothetical protein ABT39_MTgene3150 [Picea glauca]